MARRRAAPGVNPETLDPEKMSKILQNFAVNRISADAAMSLTGISSMAQLREYMHRYNIPFPRSTDAEIGPMADLVMKMVHGDGGK